MVYVGIETQLISRQPDNMTSQPLTASTEAREFNVYVLIFPFVYIYTNGDWSTQFVREARQNMSGSC